MLEAAAVGNRLAKEAYEQCVPQLRVDLLNAQYDLQHADFPVLILIVGDDRQGCNDVLHLLHDWMDARFLPVHAFGLADPQERERPWLWRYWAPLPRKGQLGVYFGAWALEAVAERLLQQSSDAEFERRVTHIRQFEQTLANDGALLLKFWLHLPKKEHKKRLKQAKQDGHARFDERDWQVYDLYSRAMRVTERLLRQTSTGSVPWHIVESTDTHYRNFTMAQTILTAILARLAEHSTAGKHGPGPSEVLPQIAGGRSVLDVVDLSAALPRPEYEAQMSAWQARLSRLSQRARAHGNTSVLVFEGWDAAGKGGVIRRLTRAMDARDYRVVPIGAPTEEEQAHHYLWRFWRHLPRAGTMLIFDRSWYGRVLVERVEGFATEGQWRRAYEEINHFEEQLAEQGILLYKFWLHIDPDTQLHRFQERESTPPTVC